MFPKTAALFCLLFLFQQRLKASVFLKDDPLLLVASLSSRPTVFSGQEITSCLNKRPSPLLHLFHSKQKKNKKIIATLLAFPFPFGIVGLHRIYLGCSPYVPVAYIASLGGVFGVLPFIDFCVLLADKDIERFANHKKIFMWVN